jgi:hypothetical protein
MAERLLTALAVLLAVWAAREVLRRRAVFLLGRRGVQLAPAVLFSFWLCGLVIGELSGCVTGMAIIAATVLLAVAFLVRGRFAPLRARHRLWSRIDWFLFLHVAAIFWFIDRWDFSCHRALAAEYLIGNVPPTALNDPKLPLVYHSIYDAVVAVALKALPVDLEIGMALASIVCVALTLSNLQAITRLLFRTPPLAQLARILFFWGFGPIFIRYLIERNNLDDFHGQTAQVFVDIIMRRPAGLGLALFTLALALILPCYRARGTFWRVTSSRATQRLVFLVPVAFLFPQLAEEGTFFFWVALLPLLLARRVPGYLLLALAVAGAAGVLRSGVLTSVVMGYHAMPVPTPHLSWPPRLPNWKNESDGVSLRSWEGLVFFAFELGPVFFGSVILAVWRGDARRRLLVLLFAAGLLVALFVQPSGWPKADLDRFFFYGTPLVFMLSAAFVEALGQRLGDPRAGRPLTVVSAVLVSMVCGPSVIWPTWHAGTQLQDAFQRHDIGGDLRRNLAAAAAREPILTTADRVDDLVMVGLTVIAPFTSRNVGTFARDGFDGYVARNANRAVWWFLPEGDARVTGRRVEGRDRDYLLVRAGSAHGNPP